MLNSLLQVVKILSRWRRNRQFWLRFNLRFWRRFDWLHWQWGWLLLLFSVVDVHFAIIGSRLSGIYLLAGFGHCFLWLRAAWRDRSRDALQFGGDELLVCTCGHQLSSDGHNVRRGVLVAKAVGAGDDTGQQRSANLLVEDAGLQ